MGYQFDPTNRPKPDKKDFSIPASIYLLILVSFERKTSQKSGKPYLRGKFTPINGPSKGKHFWDSISLDTENSGAMSRMSLLCKGCGVNEAFDLDSDADIERLFCNRPFKAQVNRTTQDGYINNGIARYETKLTEAEESIIQDWVVRHAEEQMFNGGGNDDRRDSSPAMPGDDAPARGDDDWFGGGNGGRRGGGRTKPDDDIPF